MIAKMILPERIPRTKRQREKVAKKKCWKLKFVTLLISSYFCCALPWVLNELREGIGGSEMHTDTVHYAVLIIYSLNFYFPSGICMYIRFIQRASRSEHGTDGLYLTYRYRDISIIHSNPPDIAGSFLPGNTRCLPHPEEV